MDDFESDSVGNPARLWVELVFTPHNSIETTIRDKAFVIGMKLRANCERIAFLEAGGLETIVEVSKVTGTDGDRTERVHDEANVITALTPEATGDLVGNIVEFVSNPSDFLRLLFANSHRDTAAVQNLADRHWRTARCFSDIPDRDSHLHVYHSPLRAFIVLGSTNSAGVISDPTVNPSTDQETGPGGNVRRTCLDPSSRRCP